MIYKKQKLFSVLCFTFFFSVLLSAQEPPKDLIVLVDTSASMSSFYANVTNYLTGPFLDEHLNLGDTFHLISFSGKPRFEIARRVIDLGDVQTINGRIFLMYPLEPVSDISSAISYGERYTTILPQGRQKQIFIVSDSEEKDVEGLLNAAARPQSSGITIRYLKVPLSVVARTPSQNPSSSQNPPGTSGSPSVAPVRAGTAGSSGPAASSGSPASASGSARSLEPAVSSGSARSLEPAVSSGSTGSSSAVPSGSPSPANSSSASVPQDLSDDPVQTESSVSAELPVVLSEPEEQPDLSGTVPVTDTGTLTDSGIVTDSGEVRDSQTNPVSQTTRPENTASGESFVFSLPLPLLIVLGILALLILGFVIIMMLRNLNSSPNRVMASATTIDTGPVKKDGSAARDAALLNSFASTVKAASRSAPPRRYHRDDQNQFFSNPSMLSLFVEDQNTAIGRRNVHTLKAGSRLSVGGGNSDFLIFLVPIPPQIGELRFDGTNCTFVPLKSKYFPDIGSQQVPECIGKTIRVLSDKNYELFFHFERYKDPLIALNQLLHSISVPEK